MFDQEATDVSDLTGIDFFENSNEIIIGRMIRHYGLKGFDFIDKYLRLFGVSITDMESNILWANTYAADLFGYSYKEVIGVNILDALIPKNRVEAFIQNILIPTLNRGHSDIFQAERITKNGGIIHLEVQMFIMYDGQIPKNQPMGIVSLFKDISPRRGLENQIQFLTKHFEKSSQLTPTEIRVKALADNGFTSKEIADRLNISKRTIDTHRRNIKKKNR